MTEGELMVRTSRNRYSAARMAELREFLASGERSAESKVISQNPHMDIVNYMNQASKLARLEGNEIAGRLRFFVRSGHLYVAVQRFREVHDG